MAKNVDTSVYYDVSKTLSHNAMWNFIVGGRGVGKSYSAKRWAIRDYLKRGNEFILLRRYKTELSSRLSFFADVSHEFPGYGFRIHGSSAQVTRNPQDEKPKWETMGYFVALSNAQTKKSVAYPKVTKIIFDEFIIEKSALQYLKNETRLMMDFYNTVDRFDDRVRVVFLANSVSITNPYFIQWKIEPNKEYVTKEDGYLLAHFVKSDEYRNAVEKTRFGKFIAGTEYADYSLGNAFADNSDVMIGVKHETSIYHMTLITHEVTFTIWRANQFKDASGVYYYVQEKRLRNDENEHKFTIEADMVDSDTTLLLFNDALLRMLRTAFRHGRIVFDTPRTRNTFIQIFRR